MVLLAESALELLERSAWRVRMILVVSKSFCVYRGHVEHILSCPVYESQGISSSLDRLR